MLDRDDLQWALARIHVTAPVRAEQVTGSTNAAAKSMASSGAPEWTLVSAGHQTAGRGRLDRAWDDVEGRALLVSVVLRPALTPEQAGCIPLLAGAAMAGAVRDLTGQPVLCKWPNDLLLHELKVGGILAETEVLGGQVAFLVLGVGLNLEAPAHVQGAGGIGDAASLRDLLGAFVVRFEAAYAASAPSWEERVRDAWLPVAATIGRLVEATTTSGAVIRGRAVGIDDTGALMISTDDGDALVAFGDVRHLREP